MTIKYPPAALLLLLLLGTTTLAVPAILTEHPPDLLSVPQTGRQRRLQQPDSGFTPIEETKFKEAKSSDLSFGTFSSEGKQGSGGETSSEKVHLQPAKRVEPKILIFEVGSPILGKGFKIDNGISYQRVSVKEVPKKFLFIDFKLAEKDMWQKATVTVAEAGTSTTIKQCNYDGYDSCYIPSGSVRANSTLFLTIQCQDECTYKLDTKWSDLEHLKPGDDYIFKFGEDNFQLYHVQLDNTDFEQFRVHVSPRVTNRPFDNVKIYGKFGKGSNPSPENKDFQSVNLWEDGEGLFLKAKDIKNKDFYLLLVGQPSTTYRIVCELVKEGSHLIRDGEHLYEYLKGGDAKTYHIEKFDTGSGEQFSLRVSVLSGFVKINYFSNKELTKPIQGQPFRYMDDSEYIFTSQQIKQVADDGVYVQVVSEAQERGQTSRDATYTIKFNARKKQQAVELNEHVYGFISLEKDRFAYFNFKRWVFETERSTALKFTATLLNVIGQVEPDFYLCRYGNIRSCTDPSSFSNFTEPIRLTSQQVVGEKVEYELQIEESTLSKINLVEKEGNIIVRLRVKTKGPESIGFNLVAVELLNKNKVQYLREDRPLEEKLAANEIKLYKYINSDPNVQEIRVHVSQIAGTVSMDAVIKGESLEKSITVRPEGRTLRFTTHLTSPIIVSVRSTSRAIFGISMQVILKSEMHGAADVIAIGEDLTYTVRIQPQTFTIFQITPIYFQFVFSYLSSQTIIACSMDPDTGTCLQQNPQANATKPRFSYQGKITKAKMSQDRRARVKITNPFSDSVAEVSVIFHSRQFSHCDDRKIGRVYSENVRNGTCYSFRLSDGEEREGVEVYISKREFANMRYSVFVCGNSIANAARHKTLRVGATIIQQHCSNSVEAKQIAVLWDVNTNNAGVPDLTVKVDFVVQQQGGITMLPEGLSYGVMTQNTLKPKVFGFSLINKKDTRVYIRQLTGKFKGYARVIKDQFLGREFVDETNYEFVSHTTVDYSQDPVIVISAQDIKEANCLSCTILIAVYSLEQSGRTVEYEVEVVQNLEALTDSGSVNGYLEANSIAYYYYVAKGQENTLIFFLSDHNQRCANLYLGLVENPGPTSNIQQVFEGNELIYRHNGGTMKYFLGVQAVRTCDFAVSVLQLDSSIHRLERGKQNMLKMLKGEKRYFTFENYLSQPFKVISLSKFGEVKLYLNQTAQSPNKKTWTIDELPLDTFQVHSDTSNTLSLSPGDPAFCTNCDYFVVAEALATTFSTIYLVYPETVVPLLKNKFFSDFLAIKGSKTLSSYINIEKTKLKIQVHSGKLQINAKYKNYEISKSFKAQSGSQSMVIDVGESVEGTETPKSGNDPYLNSMEKGRKFRERIPVTLVFEALDDKTSYTIEPKSEAPKGEVSGSFADYEDINAGEPNHVQLSSERILCINGHLRESDEEILITTNSDSSSLLGDVIFDAKLRGTKTEVNATITRNIVALKVVDPAPSDSSKFVPKNYEICMKIDSEDSKEDAELTEEQKEQAVKDSQDNSTEFEEEDKEVTLKAIVTQLNSVNLLPSDTSTFVRSSSTFVVHSDGEFLLDVFECKGDAKVSYSDSLEQLENQKGKLLESVGISEQRHAVKVSQGEMTFVNVRADHSIVRWLPLNFETDEGTGYLKFAAGDLLYSSKFKNMRIEFQPLQTVKKTKSKVNRIDYVLYVSNDIEKIEYASQCEPESVEDVLVLPLAPIPFNALRDEQRQYQAYNLDKNLLEAKFNGSETIYINLVAKLQLELSGKSEKNPRFVTTINDQHEHYRFIYNRQQMPLETYRPTPIESFSYPLLGLILGSVVLVLLLATYLFTRKIAPMIARLRNSNLVEEPQPEKDHEVVPPSSDRNQRAPDLQVETDERMQ